MTNARIKDGDKRPGDKRLGHKKVFTNVQFTNVRVLNVLVTNVFSVHKTATKRQTDKGIRRKKHLDRNVFRLTQS